MHRAGARTKIAVLPPGRYDFDSQYVQRLVAADPEVEGHFAKYFGDLLAIKLRSRLRSTAQVEDAKQETFKRVLIALKQKGGLTAAEHLGAFVNGVCNNVLFEMYRSGARTEPLDEEQEYGIADLRPSAESGLMAQDDRMRVQQALAGLPQKEKDLLQWLFFEERDKEDVCRELNVDRNYLRVLLHRAKARFRERFEAGAGET